MSLGLNLRLGGRGAASGSSTPSSVTRFFAPSDMTVSGGFLTDITDRITPAASDYAIVAGSISANTTTGATYTEATAGSNAIRIGPEVWHDNPGRHMAFLVRRNETADTDVTLVHDNASDANFVAGSSSNGASALSGFTTTSARSGGTEVLSASLTRTALWNLFATDTAWNVIMLQSLTRTSTTSSTTCGLFCYTYSTAFTWEGDVAGFAEFTDWSEADAVETALLAEVA